MWICAGSILSWRGEFVLVKSLHGRPLPRIVPPDGGTVLVDFLHGRNCPSKFPPGKGEDLSGERRYCPSKFSPGGENYLVHSLRGEALS